MAARTGTWAPPPGRAGPVRAAAPAAPAGVRHGRPSAVVRWTDAATMAAAAWLICAPYLLGYSGTGRLDGFWSDALAGAFLGLAALVRLAEPGGAVAVRVGSVLVAGWLAAAPFTLGYGDGSAPRATVNEVTVGVLVAVLSLIGLRALTLARSGPPRGTPLG